MKKFLAAIGILILVSALLNALGITSSNSKKPTTKEYTSAETFEKDLNDDYDLKDVTVTFRVEEIKENGTRGYALLAGEKLNFLPSKKPDSVSVGDLVTAKTTNVKKSVVTWYIYCEILSVDSDTKTHKAENATATNFPITTISPIETLTLTPAPLKNGTPTNTPAPTSTPVPTNTPIPTNTPTPTPEPIPEYTTNPLEKAKEGKTGTFSYINSDGNIHEYILIDLDEKEFYLFDHYTKDPSENFGACFQITGGNLNSGLTVKGYATEPIIFSCKFKNKNDPSVLMFIDNDGSNRTYTVTNLLSMIDIVETFDVIDFSNPSRPVPLDTPTPTPKLKDYTGKLDGYANDYYVFYVVNTNTMKFHMSYCRHISKMYAENTSYATDHGFADWDDARNWLISHGYSPCGTCGP